MEVMIVQMGKRGNPHSPKPYQVPVLSNMVMINPPWV